MRCSCTFGLPETTVPALLGSSLADVLFPSTDSVRRLAWLLVLACLGRFSRAGGAKNVKPV